MENSDIEAGRKEIEKARNQIIAGYAELDKARNTLNEERVKAVDSVIICWLLSVRNKITKFNCNFVLL